MGGDSVDLRAMRLPFSLTGGASRTKAGILNGASSSSNRMTGMSEKLYRRNGGSAVHTKRAMFTPRRRAIGVIAGLILLLLLTLWRKYQVHVEIQFYPRAWIKRNIDPVRPLSSSCFDPATIASSLYNTSLATSPKYIELHAGLEMKLGDDCYEFASTLPASPLPEMIDNLPRTTIFHTYWRDDLRPLSKRQILLLDSILAMQQESTSKVILWTNSPGPEGSLRSDQSLKNLIQRYGTPRLEIRAIDKNALARGTPMQDHPLLDAADKKAWLDGDLVRLLVLWAKGGVWVDFDTIMTGRDLRVLLEHEWVTQWDCYGQSELIDLSLVILQPKLMHTVLGTDKIYQPLNGAMMHFLQESPYLCEMLYAMANDPPPKQGSTDWGSRLYYKVFRRLIANGVKPFRILPYCFTDGQACRLDNRLPDPFESPSREKRWGKGRAEGLRSKIENVWAVHLHNQWDKQFPKGGWVERLILSRVDVVASRFVAEAVA